MDDLIKRQDAMELMDWYDHKYGEIESYLDTIREDIKSLPSAQKTAKRIVGCARNGMTMWYQCDMCHEPVDEKDTFCRGCGRRFEDE